MQVREHNQEGIKLLIENEIRRKVNQAIADSIVYAARTAGLSGVLSVNVYAVLIGFGLSLENYQQTLAKLEKAGKIRVINRCIHYVLQKG